MTRCMKHEIAEALEAAVFTASAGYMCHGMDLKDAMAIVARAKGVICQCEGCVSKRVFDRLGVED